MLALTALLSACSTPPNPVVDYRSADPHAFLEHGRSMLRTKCGHLTFIVGYVGYKPDPVLVHSDPVPFTFLVRVENDSDRALHIDPEDFRIIPSGKGGSFVAMDPEKIIRDARKDIEAEAHLADLQRNLPVTEKPLDSPLQMLAGYLLETPEDTEMKRDAALKQRHADEWGGLLRDRMRAEAEMRETVWSGSGLRKTNLASGASVEGRVAFTSDLYVDAPDTLQLQFRKADGSLMGLGMFGRVIDGPGSRPSSGSP